MDTSKMGGKVAQYNTIKGKLTPIKDNLMFLNRITNIPKMPSMTSPKVRI